MVSRIVNNSIWPMDGTPTGCTCWNSIIRVSSNESMLACVIMNYELKWDYMDIGTFHYSKVAKSIPWKVISCWPSEWAYKWIYTPAYFSHVSDVTGSVWSYSPFYFLSASWMQAEATEPVSVVILVYSAC